MAGRFDLIGYDDFDSHRKSESNEPIPPAPRMLQYAPPHLLRLPRAARPDAPLSPLAPITLLLSILSFPCITCWLIENLGPSRRAFLDRIDALPLIVPCIVTILLALAGKQHLSHRQPPLNGEWMLDLSILLSIFWLIPLVLHGLWEAIV